MFAKFGQLGSKLLSRAINIKGPKPENISIQRDTAGVPHISANNVNDLNWGLGYCQAIDRGTQLQMMRIVGQGRLCELLEDSEANLAIDHFFRRANWTQQTDEQIASLDPATRDWCQALCDGINAGFAARKVSTLKLLGYHPEPWRIKDILLILRMSGYLTLAQSQAEIERLFIELVQAGVDTNKLAALFPIDPETLDRELLEKITLGERIVPDTTLWENALPRAMASNNWVIGGKRSDNGHALMANDPHLEVNRLPNIWYEAVLQAPGYQAMGFGMPGIPGILVGRTPELSWGATYTFMDTVDSWIEHCKNGKYRRGKRWQPFQTRKELIKRKQHKDVELTFYENSHGVLDGNPEGEAFLLCTQWSPALSGAKSLNASYQLTQAKTVSDAMICFGDIESAWNWVIADSEGNIGYQMSGLCPKRAGDWNGFIPAPGWDKKYDWQGFEAPEDLPRAFNPEDGYIVTANQDLNHMGKTQPINMPMGDYRARRIAALLEEHNNHGVDSCRRMQMDTYSLQADEFLARLIPLLVKNGRLCDTANVLDNWDRCYKLNSIGAPLFEDFYAALRQRVFSERGIGIGAMHHLASDTGVFIDFYQNFDRCLLDENSPWYDGISQERAFLEAFDAARVKFKGVTWGELNRFSFINQLFQGKLPRFLGFDSSPTALIGGRATPHQGQIYQSAGRATSFAPSIRLVANMGEQSLHTALAGGPSDNRFSRWYTNGTADWLAGKFKIVRFDLS